MTKDELILEMRAVCCDEKECADSYFTQFIDLCAQYHCAEAVDDLKELRGVKVDGNDYADGINFGIDLSIQAITKRLKGDV